MSRQDFITLDGQLFNRLNWGPLGPITLRLKNGRAVVGDTKGISRGQAHERGNATPYWGRILMVSDGSETEIDYAAIVEIC